MGIDFKKISFWDNIRLQIFVSVPMALWGLGAPNRWFVACLTRWNAGHRTARFFSDLLRKYGCDHLWVWFPMGRWAPLTRTLLVLDPKSMDAVLSARDTAADPNLKKRVVSQFAPDSLVVSSGQGWSDRRPFNEGVLGFGGLHRHGEAFREIAFRSVDALTDGRVEPLRWTDFQTLAVQISQQIVLGSGQADPEMDRNLACTVKRSNWIILPRARRCFAAFSERVDRHLARHRAEHRDSPGDRRANDGPAASRCLMRDSAEQIEAGRTTPITQVPGQIDFWLYVLKDALELHVTRTLALIAAHPEIQKRVRVEILRNPLTSARAIDNLELLDACLAEQMRLWTPVPILLRRAVTPFFLRGEIPIQEEEQILMHAGFHHRDNRYFGETADKFSPDSVTDAYWSKSLFVFSRHHQSCAGQFVARFVLKATLAALLAKFRFDLVAPGIECGKIPNLYNHFRVKLQPLSD
jgi:cytochrome P450